MTKRLIAVGSKFYGQSVENCDSYGGGGRCRSPHRSASHLMPVSRLRHHAKIRPGRHDVDANNQPLAPAVGRGFLDRTERHHRPRYVAGKAWRRHGWKQRAAGFRASSALSYDARARSRTTSAHAQRRTFGSHAVAQDIGNPSSAHSWSRLCRPHQSMSTRNANACSMLRSNTI